MVDPSTVGKTIVRTVFIALVLDLMAFTMPLPLFPRLINSFIEREALLASSPTSQTLLSRLLDASHAWRSYLLSWSSSSGLNVGLSGQGRGLGLGQGQGKNWDVVLLGGAMGSLFSFCQCIISPWLGGLSDKYGRKRVLLITMLGNILSAAIWMKSTTFTTYLFSRVVGGLSEGNVQLSTAIISDVTTAETRSKSLALVGIAFSVCFTLGPSIGAYFASRPLPLSSSANIDIDAKWNVFAFPAAISLGLLVVETLYLGFRLPETKDFKQLKSLQQGTNGSNLQTEGQAIQVKASREERLQKLRNLGRAHGLFLLFFSGASPILAEFTLTFLTFDLLSYSNAQNGRLLSFIGILSAGLQGGYVRRKMAKVGEVNMASTGIFACVLALFTLSALPSFITTPGATAKVLHSTSSSNGTATMLLYIGAACLAYTSATVVSCLTAAAAAQTDEDSNDSSETSGKAGNATASQSISDSRLKRGKALGRYRSAGQLGRALGPLVCSSIYWLAGPQIAYAGLAACLVLVWGYVRGLRETRQERQSKIKSQ